MARSICHTKPGGFNSDTGTGWRADLECRWSYIQTKGEILNLGYFKNPGQLYYIHSRMEKVVDQTDCDLSMFLLEYRATRQSMELRGRHRQKTFLETNELVRHRINIASDLMKAWYMTRKPTTGSLTKGTRCGSITHKGERASPEGRTLQNSQED